MEFTVEKLREGMAVCQLSERRQAYLEQQLESVLPYLPAFVDNAVPFLDRIMKTEENHLTDPPADLPKKTQNALMIIAYCFMTEGALKYYLAKGYSEENWRDNMPDINWHMHENPDGELWMDTLNGSFSWHLSNLNATNVLLGRLQFYKTPSEFDCPQYGINKGEPLLGIHIPANGRMDIDKCLDAMRRAQEFFAKLNPPWVTKGFTCHSWLLNPVYKKYLSPQSNIVRFQDLGTMFDIGEKDQDSVNRVFNYGEEDVNLPGRTTIQRAVQTMLKTGESMASWVGIFPRV